MKKITFVFLLIIMCNVLYAQPKKILISPKYDSREIFVLEGEGKNMQIAHQSHIQSQPYQTQVTNYQNNGGQEKWYFTTQTSVQLVLFYEVKKGFEWATQCIFLQISKWIHFLDLLYYKKNINFYKKNTNKVQKIH